MLPGPPHAPPTPPYRCICLSWLGELLLIPGPPHAPPTMLFLSVLVGRDGFDQAVLTHPRLIRGSCSACEIQLTPRIPTQMYFVGSPATDLRLSCHDFCCNRNTIMWKIQIEEKSSSINPFIGQLKNRYIRSCVIVVSITMPPLTGMSK